MKEVMPLRFGVIYHSRWGNCERIARAIAGGLAESGNEVIVTDTGAIGGLGLRLDCLLLGSPTRKGRASKQVRRFVKRHVTGALEGTGFVSFGTGLDTELAGSKPQSADEIHMLLVQRNLKPLAPPFKAAVTGWQGPLEAGEMERAFQFGRDVGLLAPLRTGRTRGDGLKRAV